VFFPSWQFPDEVYQRFPGKESMEYMRTNPHLNRLQALRSGITSLIEIGGPLYTIDYYNETVKNKNSPTMYSSGIMLWVIIIINTSLFHPQIYQIYLLLICK
jgi:hypothetical protein